MLARHTKTLRAAAAIAMVIGWSSLSLAQSSGAFGSRSFGGSNNARQGTAFGGPAGGSLGGTPSGRLDQAQQGAGEISGSERFLRDARQPGAFVGADSGDAQNFFSQATGNIGNNRLNLTGGRATGQNQRLGNQGFGSTRIIRRRLHVGFTVRQPDRSTITQTLDSRLARLSPRLPGSPGIEVLVEGTTVVLRGTVSSDEARLLAERLVRLEPGVWDVRNELVVADSLMAPAGNSARLPPG